MALRHLTQYLGILARLRLRFQRYSGKVVYFIDATLRGGKYFSQVDSADRGDKLPFLRPEFGCFLGEVGCESGDR